MLRCADDTLYTGVARDLGARIETHNSGRGAKYTKTRRPVQLVWSEPASDRSSAQKREYAIKRLSRADKLQMIS